MSSIVETLTASGGTESVGFLNDIVRQLWPNICVAGARMIKGIAEPIFETTLPAPLNTMHFKKVDLGTVPLHFSKVDVHKTENDGIKLDLDIDWDGKCDVELDGNMMPTIGIEHFKLRGRLSILLCPLTNVLPLIGAAQVAFINPPYLKLDFTDAAHIANLSLIDNAIRKVMISIISSMAVLPNRFLVKIDPTNDFFRTYQHPTGVLRLTVLSGSNLGEAKEGKSFLQKLVHDEPDCYAKVAVSAEAAFQTATVKNARAPEWNETYDFVVSDYDQRIAVDVNDDDTARRDDDIGEATTTVRNLLLSGGRLELPLFHKEARTEGSVRIAGRFFNFVPDPASFAERGPGICGLLTVLVASAFGIQGRREALQPSVKVDWAGHGSFRTGIKKDAPGSDVQNPSWDQAFRVPIRAGMVPGAPVKITLMDGEQERGSVEVDLGEVLAAEGMRLEKSFEVGDGATVRAGVWLRGIVPAE
ncbi:Extended synaptotagmin-3 [Madurella fahalii]|uniref:Extended synaptotagmin-3 n=1 Tax=Madurella fahalii TaxID=1157608 RepID=A0ABQ0GH61_9PEZI